MSAFSADGGVTANTPRSMAYLEPTIGPDSARTRGTLYVVILTMHYDR